MCECLKQVRESVKEDNKANYVQIDCSTITAYPKSDPVQYKTGQRISINYNHTKRNGEIIKKNRNSFVTHEYCPFCGIKY